MADALRGPWLLEPNRVRRFYRGGALLERFRGADPAAARDGDDPEDWLGSATRVWTPPGPASSDEGLSRVTVHGRGTTIAALLADDPEGVAGADLVRLAGPTLGLLVKLLDAAVRLPVHAHPPRPFARRHLGSSFGKTEAWVVLAIREVPGEPAPHVRIGFRREVGREELAAWVAEQRTAELVGALHELPVQAGDVWLVPAGTAHAIGAGVFLLELQEPTDLSIVAETRGVPVEPVDAHLGLGWELALDAIDRRGLGPDDLDALRLVPFPPPIAGALPRARLLPPAADPFFRAERWTVRGESVPIDERAFLVGVVIRGEGEASVRGGEAVPLRPGVAFAVPARGLPGLSITATDLELVACLPPRPEDLATEAAR